MAVVPSPRTWLAGETVTAGYMNTEINYAISWLLSGFPLFQATQAVTQVVADITWTAITFSTEDIDRDGGHSTAVNTSRYTAATAGRYRVVGSVPFNLTGTSLAAARLAVNGTAVPGTARFFGRSDNNFLSASTSHIVYLGVGDYVELQGWHNAGDFWNTEVTSDMAPTFSAEFISS